MNNIMFPIAYSLLKSVIFKIRELDGNIQNVTYGTGEIICIMKPIVNNEIILSNGRIIIEYPNDLSEQLVRVNKKNKE
jgi:hypothetical protein